MANQANSDSRRSGSRPDGSTGEVPPWGTPPEAPRHGEPGYTLDAELDPRVAYRPRPQYPEASQGVLALVLGLIGLFLFAPVAPAAWIIGRRELRSIEQGRRNPRQRTLGQIGFVLGIVGTVVLVVAVLLLGLVLTLVLAAISSLL